MFLTSDREQANQNGDRQCFVPNRAANQTQRSLVSSSTELPYRPTHSSKASATTANPEPTPFGIACRVRLDYRLCEVELRTAKTRARIQRSKGTWKNAFKLTLTIVETETAGTPSELIAASFNAGPPHQQHPIWRGLKQPSATPSPRNGTLVHADKKQIRLIAYIAFLVRRNAIHDRNVVEGRRTVLAIRSRCADLGNLSVRISLRTDR